MQVERRSKLFAFIVLTCLPYCVVRILKGPLLGHADLETTEIYARIDREMKRKVLEEAFTNIVPSEAVPLWQQDGELLN
jgi:hypothetical protein